MLASSSTSARDALRAPHRQLLVAQRQAVQARDRRLRHSVVAVLEEAVALGGRGDARLADEVQAAQRAEGLQG